MKFFKKDFLSKCDQIHKKLRIGSHLLKKSLMETFIFLFNGQVATEYTEEKHHYYGFLKSTDDYMLLEIIKNSPCSWLSSLG